jgi:DNA-binding MarR family transcriptional regulator
VIGHQIAMALRRAYLAMHRRTEAAIAGHGVTADQFVLLDALAGGDAVTQREVARRTGSDPNTVRAMLLLLEKRGLVARPPHPTDGRARAVALTPAGRRKYRTLWAASEAVRSELTEAVASDTPERVIELLDRLTRVLAPAGPRKPTP